MAANYTDPQVIFDPNIPSSLITRKYWGVSYRYDKTEDDMESSPNNEYNTLKIDGIEYPLVVINTHTVEQRDILYMAVKFTNFLPEIEITIMDALQSEQKLETTQMSGNIEIAIVPRAKDTYKSIKIHFSIDSVTVDTIDPCKITYFGTYDAEQFRQVNTGFLKKDNTKANLYELLYVIAQKTGLGFAATEETENIEDRVLRNIFTQRYPDYIKSQLKFAGCDEDSILDAWVDPYSYIVLVNMSWVLSQELKPEDLTIVAIKGFPSTDRDVPDPEPEETSRILTNFNRMPTWSNLQIKSYSMIVNNDAVYNGTTERIYTVNWDSSNATLLNTLDIQTKQNSVDGEYTKDYDTGFNRPIPVYNFNDDDYDLNIQKIIRKHYFNKRRQQILKVKLAQPNLGLQRGTLVTISIFEQNSQLKEIMMSNEPNVFGDQGDKKPPMTTEDDHDLTDIDILTSEGIMFPNVKLSDIYYIDGIVFEYSLSVGEIEQTLYLIKQGKTSGYHNAHTKVRMDDQI